MFNSFAVQVTLAMLVLVGMAAARPRFLLIPVEVQESSLRVAREAWSPGKDDTEGRVERQAQDHGHHDHVDYGAHTGHHGAFGWYADFPVTTHH
ncbi:uncharacterized protein LOC124362924 isoform X2 [Homalodisca vitripennis]|uniref:uncharacterized protein LOC124362924 isoform X2 n=1 Tax=Homalodisca vitripennis TaxID=197043 RepID=UPI001EE9C3B7|nr:uncharacterized protein LOC124362924 isoform X2 [Homalodisca vitripennis]